jgi:carbon storage regulator CsrA
MLVLSRRTNEKIFFPCINATVQIISLKGGTVRLGIDAPSQVEVYRTELLDRRPPQVPPAPPPDQQAVRQALHQVNNRLNSATIGLALLRRQFDLGLLADMQLTLDRVTQELAGLRESTDAVREQVVPPEPALLRRRALLVEDDVNECELLAGFLRLAGLEVDTANDGADALDHLKTHPRPDFVLMDMLLPRCDGATTVRAIRGEPAWTGLRIFGVTGADPQRFNLPQGPDGVDRWFPKPINPEALLRELNRELHPAR